jgi:hypothetical protein
VYLNLDLNLHLHVALELDVDHINKDIDVGPDPDPNWASHVNIYLDNIDIIFLHLRFTCEFRIKLTSGIIF